MTFNNVWDRVPGSNLARSGFEKIFGKKNEVNFEKLNLNLRGKVHFVKVEENVDNFVENEVPASVDVLYRLSREIVELQKSGEEGKLAAKFHKATEVVKGINAKLLEIDELRSFILDSDLDYFDLRIKPVKHKINQAIIHFYDVTNLPLSVVSPSHSGGTPLGRSPKARDLLSILSDGESENSADTLLGGPIEQVQAEQRGPEVSEEDLTSLNEDLVDLHDIMKSLHASVHEQGREVNDISANVEVAEVNIMEGNSHLRKAAVLKAAMFPLVGAVVGGVVGGPLGFVAGVKVGMTTGVAVAGGVTGSVLGYQGGKLLKKNQNLAEDKLKDLNIEDKVS